MRKLLFMLLCVPLLAAQQSVGMEGIKWMFNTGGYVTSPVIHDDAILFGSSNGNFYALSLENGSPLWVYSIASKIESSPALSDKMVFFGSNDGKLYALWLNGTLAWNFNTNGVISATPLVSNKMVFFGSNDGKLYALWLNGTLAWNFSTGNKILSSSLLAYNIVYFDSTDGSIYGLDASNGKVIWKYSGEAPFASSPIAYSWIVYAGSDDGNLYAFNAFNGSVVWKQMFPSKIQSSFVISPQNILYFTCKDGNTYAVYVADGSKYWNITTGTETQSSVYHDNASGFSYFGTSDNDVYAANSTGSVIWKFETGNWVISTPLLHDGILYVGSYDGNLYAISTIRTYPPPDMNVTGSPVMINGTAYADAGIQYVQLRLKGGDWKNATGVENWSYDWDTYSLSDGAYIFEVRSFDKLGNAESPPYSNLSLNFSAQVIENDMVVSFPQETVVGMPITFEVNDTNGNPVPNAEVTIFGKTYMGDDKGVVATDENGSPIKSDVGGEFNFTVTAAGYRMQSGTIKVMKVVDVLPSIIGIILILIVTAVLIYIGVMRLMKRMKKQ